MPTPNTIFDQAFENSPIGMALVDVSGILLRCNPVFASMLGRTTEQMTGISFATITHPDDLDADNALFSAILAGQSNGYRMHKRYLHADGQVIEACLTVTAARDERGDVELVVSQIEDVTERRAGERQLREHAARLALAVEAVQGGFWHVDVATRVFETSAGLSRYIDAKSEALNFAGYLARVESEDLEAADPTSLLNGEVDTCSAKYRLRTQRGKRWVRCDRRVVRDRDGRPEQIVGMVVDIHDEHQRHVELQEVADTDPLTGLLNRRGLERRFNAVEPVLRRGVILVDLNGFKLINDRYGHAAGDDVLVEYAKHLQARTRRTDYVARIGGDEFAIVLDNIPQERLDQIKRTLDGGAAISIQFLAGCLVVSASVGAAWCPDGRTQLSELLAAADQEMYSAKRGAKAA